MGTYRLSGTTTEGRVRGPCVSDARGERRCGLGRRRSGGRWWEAGCADRLGTATEGISDYPYGEMKRGGGGEGIGRRMRGMGYWVGVCG